MNVEPTSPCRLFVYLAQSAPLAVVLRRGPSDWVQLSLWHTDSDTFTQGQWFKGRVYERRCDLSADGSIFVYFARKTTGRTLAEPAHDSWLAVSRPPWFTALALWFVGGTYCAGGFFPAPRSLWLGGTEPPDLGALPHWLSLTTAGVEQRPSPDWTEQTVVCNRRLRDGWERLPDRTDRGTTWQRRHPGEPLTLTLTEHSGDAAGAYAVQADGGTVHQLGVATWADWDQRGRLILAQEGRLVHWQAPHRRFELADFNSLRPNPLPAPDWVRRWPD